MQKAKSKVAVLLVTLLGLTSLASSQTSNPKSTVIQDFNADLADSPTPKIRIDSIFPSRGPMTGETHVIVRGGPFGKWQTQYQKPVCKFGGKVVKATYVTCTATQLTLSERENVKEDRSHTCVQCDNNPETTNEGNVKFQVSVTGDFSDSVNSVEFEYFTQLVVERIFPKYGPKDGWDEAWERDDIQIWGQNFKKIKGETLVSFGTHAVVANVINSTYLTCKSPQSDVVAKAIPISISQNGGQYAPSTLFYYYYNWPQITEVEPERGPESGGTIITLKGRNFDPFKEVKDQIDNSPDVYCSFSPQNLKRPAKVISSTIATCVAPPSYYYHQSMVELTLNDFIYTGDQNIFFFYKPPTLYDVKPREGPLHGGTTVRVNGAGFSEKDEIKAKIGNKIVNGTFINNQELVFVSPPGIESGWTTVMISNKPGLWSSPLPYLYYEVPTVSAIGPLCGPDTGFTQLAVTGKNFVDLGTNKAMCVFNGTVFMNATVMNSNLLYCDSPPFLDHQGYSLMGKNGDFDDFYQVQITLDGGNQIQGEGFLFYYYRQAKVTGVAPFGGPLQGGSEVTINVTGLNQKSACDVRVRFSTQDVSFTKQNDDQLQAYSPSAILPGTVVIQVALNGQQYTSERITGEKDPQSSFDYYSNPIISYHSPNQGPSSGNTIVKIQGYGFKDFIPQDQSGATSPQNQLYARFVDPGSRAPLSQGSEIKDFSNNEATWSTPPQAAGTNALLQISRNGQDWLDVKDPNPSVAQSFQYYASPHITSVNPPYGPVKNPDNINLTLTGSNFVCPAGDCSKLFVKFFDKNQNKITVSGTLINSNQVMCVIPKYTKPDVLRVEVSFNGFDFTNDNKTYGYYDPYLIDVKPRLIAKDGSTKLTLIGLGFADSGQIKVSFNNVSSPISCHGQTCTQPGSFVDSHTVSTSTLPQSAVAYKNSNGSGSIGNDPFTVGIAIYNDQYNDNNIQVHYYQDVSYLVQSSLQNPCNTETNLKVQVKLSPDDVEIIRKYGDPKVRFVAPNNFTSITDCDMSFTESEKEVTLMTCRIPRWDSSRGNAAKMDFSINGQDFTGSFDFTFTESLILDRIVPMAGPLSSATAPLRLIGQGFKPSDPALEIDFKWGPIETASFTRTSVSNYPYTFSDFLNIVPNNEDLKSYWYEADTIKRVDEPMVNGKNYELYQGKAVQLNSLSFTNPSYPSSQGGPFYVDVGRNLQVDSQNTARQIFYDYQPSSVEYFHYKQCSALNMYPNHGLTIGGTKVQVSGFDFRFQPEYGIVPHCRFGDQIVKAYFDSTVRIVCESPPNTFVGVAIPFEVSLNGFDWTDTGFTFSYFQEAEITSYFPESGSAAGGTQIFIFGKNFPKINNPLEFNARFTPQYAHMAPRIMAVDWHNDTCVSVISPGGWSEGDKMALQLTFNGVDYDQHNFTFTMYKIKQMSPRSGPSNGLGGDIVVRGEGFRPEQQYLCKLNGTVYEALSYNWTEIRCPMVKAQEGDTFFGNVDFSVSANGGSEWHNFVGGFQYYQQPTVLDIFPKTGPAHGLGIVNFYGSMFRTDYALSQLSCRIGSTIGTAVFVSNQQIRCVVEDMESVPEGQKLSAQVALNGYSWTQTSDDTFFVPYSVNAIFPTSGPTAGGSDVIVLGSGFVNDAQNTPRCRFGTPSNYAIVEAVILSYNKLSCTAPPSFQTRQPEIAPFETPISVALTQDNFDPWTQTYHRFRYYKQPVISQIFPEEVEIGLITEVLATIDPSTGAENIFFQPASSDVGRYDPTGETKNDEVVTALFANTQIKCRFGRFGETLAVIVNSTTLKCVTPSVSDDPEDIYREKVKFTIAMNGFDFDEESSTNDFTFIGTGYSLGLLPQILGILLIGVLIIAGIVFIQNYYVHLSRAFDSRPARPYVADFGNDTIQQRALRVVHGNRSGQSFSRADAGSIGRFQDPDNRPQSRIPPFSPFAN